MSQLTDSIQHLLELNADNGTSADDCVRAAFEAVIAFVKASTDPGTEAEALTNAVGAFAAMCADDIRSDPNNLLNMQTLGGRQ